MEEVTRTDIEMTSMSNGNDGTPRVNGQDASKDEIDGFPRKKNDPETEGLLENDGALNGNTVAIDSHSNHDIEASRPSYSPQKKSAVCQVKEELTQKVCKDRVPLWVVLILIFLLIIGLIFASLALCTVIYDDVDDKYDSRMFEVQRHFNGSFLLPNLNFTEEQLNLSSNESHTLAAELNNKLDDLYTNSPALGRYFSSSEIYDLSEAPAKASFHLKFRMPAVEQSELKRFTLSRSMVYNVLRQFLFDQEDTADRLYIEPASLNMSE